MLKPQKAKAILLAKIVIPLNKTQRSTPFGCFFISKIKIARLGTDGPTLKE